MRTAPPLSDASGRRIEYLRLSVTDRCDLRCLYCQPAEGSVRLERASLSSRDDLVLVGRAAAACGIGKIRLTGGEPLCRADLQDVVSGLSGLHLPAGLQMTTNGLGLAERAADLARAGLAGVNVSIDSLDPGQYARITRGGDLGRCLAGIQAALDAGLQVKLNVVVLGGVNEDQILPMVERFADLPVAVRFIEYMPGAGPSAAPARTVPAARILQILDRRFTLQPVAAEPLGGPALRYLLAGRNGRVGIIAPLTRHFCGACNRLRVAADARVHGCLFGAAGLSLRPHLDRGDLEGIVEVLRLAAAVKPAGHGFGAAPRDGEVGSFGAMRSRVMMSRTGG